VPVYEPLALAYLAEQAGLTGPIGLLGLPPEVRGHDRRQIAVAVALAESGGNSDTVNTNKDGSKDVGLWQINLKAHPEYTQAELLDPFKNAAAMAKISSQGNNWAAWTGTVPNGKYKAHLATAATAVDQVGTGAGNSFFDQFADSVAPHLPDVPDIPGMLGKLVDVLGAFLGAVVNVGWWKRLALGLAAVVVLSAGVSLIAKDSLVPTPLAQLASAIAQKG
jgi:hypothetical protein